MIQHNADLISGNLYEKFKDFSLVGSTAWPSKTIAARSDPNIILKRIPGTLNTKPRPKASIKLLAK